MPDYFYKIKKSYKENVQSVEGLKPGIIRTKRGQFVEFTCKTLVEEAWARAGGDVDKLKFDNKKYKLEIEQSYLDKLEPELKKYIEGKKDKYFYGIKVDTHVRIDGRFIMGIECKSYTENAMLKRIMVDFTFLKKAEQNLICVLLQLESMLGGDYEKARKSVIGSPQSHSIMAQFSNIDLHILTLLEGPRKVKEQIFEKDHFKTLKRKNVEYAVQKIQSLLTQFV